MTCHHCRHSREIAQLAEIPDEAKREAERARLAAICSKCHLGKDLPGDGSISLDAIHDGTVEKIADVAPNFATAYTFDPGEIDGDAPEAARPTNLPGADEDTLRQLLATAVGLDPFQIVVVLHVARRSQKTASQAIRDFAADVRAHKETSIKATFHQKWKTMVGKIPELAAIRTATQTEERRGD